MIHYSETIILHFENSICDWKQRIGFRCVQKAHIADIPSKTARGRGTNSKYSRNFQFLLGVQRFVTRSVISIIVRVRMKLPLKKLNLQHNDVYLFRCFYNHSVCFYFSLRNWYHGDWRLLQIGFYTWTNMEHVMYPKTHSITSLTVEMRIKLRYNGLNMFICSYVLRHNFCNLLYIHYIYIYIYIYICIYKNQIAYTIPEFKLHIKKPKKTHLKKFLKKFFKWVFYGFIYIYIYIYL